MLESSVVTLALDLMDASLKSLILAAKSQPPNENSKALTPLTQEIVKLRSLCRPAALDLKVPIFLEIFATLQTQILEELQHNLEQYDGERPPIRQWAVEIIATTCRIILTDPRLKAIALYAQSTPEHSRERHIAFTEMVQSIRLSGKLARPHRSKFSTKIL